MSRRFWLGRETIGKSSAAGLPIQLGFRLIRLFQARASDRSVILGIKRLSRRILPLSNDTEEKTRETNNNRDRADAHRLGFCQRQRGCGPKGAHAGRRAESYRGRGGLCAQEQRRRRDRRRG